MFRGSALDESRLRLETAIEKWGWGDTIDALNDSNGRLEQQYEKLRLEWMEGMLRSTVLKYEPPRRDARQDELHKFIALTNGPSCSDLGARF